MVLIGRACLGETELRGALEAFRLMAHKLYIHGVCVRESWARSMRTCALALRVQVRHKHMLSTCEKTIDMTYFFRFNC